MSSSSSTTKPPAPGPSRPITPTTAGASATGPSSSTRPQQRLQISTSNNSPRKQPSSPVDVQHSPLGGSHGFTSSSYQRGQPGHLRQRSIQTPQSELHDPFSDQAAARPARNDSMPHRIVTTDLPKAALMGSADPFADDSDAGHSAIAHNMRNDRPEWTPTQQYLYSESALSHSSTGLNPLPFSGPMSARSSPRGSPSSSLGDHSSTAHFNVVADPALLKAYSALAYTDEVDDALHDAGPPAKRFGADRRIAEPVDFKGRSSWTSSRGILNMGAVVILGLGLIMLFGGLPIYTAFAKASLSNFGASGLGGTNSTGQVPDIPSFRGLIDKDTPEAALSRTGYDGKAYQLVFSDEFEQDGRLFSPGMDPYFEAVDLHYWQTVNIEWYDPDSITTKDGALEISLTKETNASSHGRGYLGGMLQSWNQFCFTGGYIEVAISLPGDTKTLGLWPAAWTMSNLGRAGHGGSLDGTWPYTYDECDVGTLMNQTDPVTGLPKVVKGTGDKYNHDALSYLGGQRLSACTCPGEDHPGPVKPDGTFGGRGATEIDIFEATITDGVGEVSMSGQWAPFNPSYEYVNSSTDYVEFFDNKYNTRANTYLGGAYQQVTSGLAETDPTTYNSSTKFNDYGFEYKPSYIDGFGTGSITWTQGGQRMWRISDQAMKANAASNVSNRGVTGEPMYMLFNLGMSENFGYVDLENLVFPSVMRIDYIRIYQDSDYINIGM
ncbi:beta-glucan synthesis-associated protein-domain-containing protein [Leucosporidium creatinivorum]|uniref:Beta-glucan synthesis-associated protein-domain-containing protein n=1 Tax=Leucosporidium creatinivorum TaxID=106004 RepID=A0A1Y2G5A4_9BASI|nr:beta-glucan synthesis-associated protein-domain-containing protein [Leucosporidium creatinivorum]